jgi:hypothetical protein
MGTLGVEIEVGTYMGTLGVVIEVGTYTGTLGVVIEVLTGFQPCMQILIYYLSQVNKTSFQIISNLSSIFSFNWPSLWSNGQSSWLQIQRSGLDSWRYQIFWEVVSLERGPLSLSSTIEELLRRKSSCSCLEIRENGLRDPSRWPRGALYPQKLALTSPKSGGHSVGIVRSRTQATEFFFSVLTFLAAQSAILQASWNNPQKQTCELYTAAFPPAGVALGSFWILSTVWLRRHAHERKKYCQNVVVHSQELASPYSTRHLLTYLDILALSTTCDFVPLSRTSRAITAWRASR